MSKARRETKCFRCSIRWNGQANSPVQRRTTVSAPPAVVSRASGVFSGQGQTSGNSNGSASAGRSSSTGPDHLRDHVAGALDDHGVADADVLARDLVGVVQGGVADGGAADEHRLQLGRPASRRRCGRPGSRCPRAWWSPARRGTCGRWPSAARGRRSPAGPASPAGRPCRRRRRCRSRAPPAARAGPRRPPSGPPRPRPVAPAGWSACPRLGQLRSASHWVAAKGSDGLAPGVGEEAQRPPRGDARVDLAQRARGGVARVDVGPLAPLGAGGVHGLEVSRGRGRPRRGSRSASGQPSPARRRGMSATVRRLAVTSSPTRPSPRVAPCTSTPFS